MEPTYEICLPEDDPYKHLPEELSLKIRGALSVLEERLGPANPRPIIDIVCRVALQLTEIAPGVIADRRTLIALWSDGYKAAIRKTVYKYDPQLHGPLFDEVLEKIFRGLANAIPSQQRKLRGRESLENRGRLRKRHVPDDELEQRKREDGEDEPIDLAPLIDDALRKRTIADRGRWLKVKPADC